MSVPFQASLLDSGPGLGNLAQAHRTELAGGAWVDVLPGWLREADTLFTTLVQDVPWQAERRRMYDAIVDVPRLLAFYREGMAPPDPMLDAAKEALSRHYRIVFTTAGLCLYRDGRDSVAWHGDRVGRGSTEDTCVAIASLGATRVLALRPRTGGPALRFPLAHGDLLVMGGSCQRTWDHAVPKSTRPTGPRVSIQFRPRDVL
ncbi:alpha-ketoglutarate-dependent dioxygenase AlkB [Actinokineospora globicatena]|uniref:alpha-ketoglutarate-dependent dioxygenase AlkB n=1 Tax=Actinokineospora globicatena TaxID=103729 RepID=UPI0020A29924|nr:alpha-ketoglutarate-dependent dioxygenase AlkB [Actinokineospora globicatena]MCP2304924.1 Alkylated DNA repair dioxygenase AlkB [Actinokineospora globicatena]GLW77693.1 alkylated DNA repair protein [Actinokineospora globicatena]GLW85638.1 alkylated DNA repair protein [Actinokineospora globicatena]